MSFGPERVPVFTDDGFSDELSFDYLYAPINALTVLSGETESGQKVVRGVTFEGKTYEASSRFWVSLYSRYGFNSAFFKYFDYPEVFERIAKQHGGDQMRLCIENSTVSDKSGNDKQVSRFLGVSNPEKPVVGYNDLMRIVTQFGGSGYSYTNGVLESLHSPRAGAGDFTIGGDLHNNRFVLSCPVDGYGLPSAYLALLRQICDNGAIAYTKTFRASLALGKKEDDVCPALIRMLDGYNNDEGFAAIRERFTSSTNSWASVYEAGLIYDRIVKMHSNGEIYTENGKMPKQAKQVTAWYKQSNGQRPLGEEEINSPLFHAFHAMTGDVTQLYGLANMDALSVKRQRALPVKATVYDLINFATEVSTHYSTPTGTRAMNALVGGMIANEYDLEGSCSKFKDFEAFHIQGKFDQALTGSVPVLAN